MNGEIFNDNLTKSELRKKIKSHSYISELISCTDDSKLIEGFLQLINNHGDNAGAVFCFAYRFYQENINDIGKSVETALQLIYTSLIDNPVNAGKTKPIVELFLRKEYNLWWGGANCSFLTQPKKFHKWFKKQKMNINRMEYKERLSMGLMLANLLNKTTEDASTSQQITLLGMNQIVDELMPQLT